MTLIMIFLTFSFVLTESQTSQTQQKVSLSQVDGISHQNWSYQSQRKCGLIDRNIYINNGTFEQVQFYSDQYFSLFLSQNSELFSFTGFALARQLNKQNNISEQSSDQKINNNKRPVYKISSIPIEAQGNQSFNKYLKYYTKLSIYGICKTIAVSTIFKEIEVQINYFGDNIAELNATKNLQKNQNKSPIPCSSQNCNNYSNHSTIKIPATLYCITGKSIKQTNFYVLKVFYILFLICFTLLLNFRPLKLVPVKLRVMVFLFYIWLSFQPQTFYQAIISSYGLLLILVIFYGIFYYRRTRHNQASMSQLQQIMLSKRIQLVFIVSAIPLAIKSHLDDDKVQQRHIILHIANIIMICNNLLFISSIINLNRFRTAFYYYIVFCLVEYFFKNKLENLLSFNILQIQMYPTQFQCDSMFFVIMLIPLCDFFFKFYSYQSLYKLFIILVPALAKPFIISYSVSFGIGIIICAIIEAFRGKDLTRIIYLKRQ